jgi:hypothetical protein
MTSLGDAPKYAPSSGPESMVARGAERFRDGDGANLTQGKTTSERHMLMTGFTPHLSADSVGPEIGIIKTQPIPE